jgi:hypothetical protein
MRKKKYKSRHNKKRNTAFLYEVLVQEITRSVVDKDEERKEKALNICKEFFGKNSPLYKERGVYNALLESRGLERDIIEKVLSEAKSEYSELDLKEIFNTQTKLINKVNKILSSDVLNYFVPNYKNLATIAQLLNKELPVKERVLLEDKFANDFSDSGEATDTLEPTDNLVYKTFVKHYNEKYERSLLEEQKEIITRHAVSFSDRGISLKIFLNEEIGRLRNALKISGEMDIFTEDAEMKIKLDEVCGILNSFKEKPTIEDNDIIRLMEVQNLVREIKS